MLSQLKINELNTQNEYLSFSDSQSAIALAYNPEYHFKTKHIDIQYHFVRDNVQNGLIKLKYIPTKEQIADIFTKSLDRIAFERLIEYMRLG
jgi:hypothetical protein